MARSCFHRKGKAPVKAPSPMTYGHPTPMNGLHIQYHDGTRLSMGLARQLKESPTVISSYFTSG